MKMFRCLLAIALVCELTGVAKANPIDFHMGVLDPVPQPTYTLVDGTTPFAVAFGACPSNIVADGCFTGYNDTKDVTFTSLHITFTNTTSNDPSDQINFLNGQTPTCDTNSPQSLFSNASCSLSPDETTYILDFFGGLGIAPGQFFFITEIGPVPNAFQGGIAEVSSVPEPNTVLLLSTGMAMIGLIIIRRRGTAAHVSRL
jgi:hypothetical protein